MNTISKSKIFTSLQFLRCLTLAIALHSDLFAAVTSNALPALCVVAVQNPEGSLCRRLGEEQRRVIGRIIALDQTVLLVFAADEWDKDAAFRTLDNSKYDQWPDADLCLKASICLTCLEKFVHRRPADQSCCATKACDTDFRSCEECRGMLSKPLPCASEPEEDPKDQSPNGPHFPKHIKKEDEKERTR